MVVDDNNGKDYIEISFDSKRESKREKENKGSNKEINVVGMILKI